MHRVNTKIAGAMTLELILALTLLLLSTLPLLELTAQSLKFYSEHVDLNSTIEQCEPHTLEDGVLVLRCSNGREDHLFFLEPIFDES